MRELQQVSKEKGVGISTSAPVEPCQSNPSFDLGKGFFRYSRRAGESAPDAPRENLRNKYL